MMSTNQIVALTLASTHGVMPYYLFPEDGDPVSFVEPCISMAAAFLRAIMQI